MHYHGTIYFQLCSPCGPGLICRPGWSQVHRDPLASASIVLRLKTWATTTPQPAIFSFLTSVSLKSTQPGERAAARPGGHRARNRRHPPERRNGDPGTVQGENERAASRPAGGSLHRFCAARGGGTVGSDPLPNPGGHRAAPRGLQLLLQEGLPNGAKASGLCPPQDQRCGANLRADAGELNQDDSV